MNQRLARLRDGLLLTVGANALAGAAILALARRFAGNLLGGLGGFSPAAQAIALAACAAVAVGCLAAYALLPPPGGRTAATGLTRGGGEG